jgi:hypothetical protein
VRQRVFNSINPKRKSPPRSPPRVDWLSFIELGGSKP